jgi:hypothetical protein
MIKIIYCFFYYNVLILKSFIDVFVFVKDLIIKIINYLLLILTIYYS